MLKFIDAMCVVFMLLLVWVCTLCLTALTYGTYLMFFGSSVQ